MEREGRSRTGHPGRVARPWVRRLGQAGLLVLLGLAGPLGPSAPLGPDGVRAQAPAAGIVVVGSVFDLPQGTPIPQARLRFSRVSEAGPGARTDSEPAADVLTGANGDFRTGPLDPFFYQVRVTAFGYQDFEQQVRIEGASPLQLTVRLVPEAVPLDPILVRSVRSPRLDRAGFYDRRERGSGVTFTHEEILRATTLQVSDAFRMLAGVRVEGSGSGLRPLITFRGGCVPDIVLDGVNLGATVRLDDVISRNDVEGIEVYRSATAGLAFANSSCGTIVVWSADPSARDGEPFRIRNMLLAVGLFVASFLAGR